MRRAQERLNRDSTSSLSKLGLRDDFTAEDIAREAKNGDDFAAMMLERTGRSIGIAVASMINLLSIERVIVGGPIMEAGDFLLDPIIEEAKKRSTNGSWGVQTASSLTLLRQRDPRKVS